MRRTLRILNTVTHRSAPPETRAVLDTLRSALARGPVTITTADLDGLMGVTLFPERTVAISPDLDAGEFRATLVHELLHLIRGPVTADLIDAEEEAVERATADLLVPNAAALTRLPHRWTRPQMALLAESFGADLATVQLALNPPTRPMPAVARTLTQDSVALAARKPPEQT